MDTNFILFEKNTLHAHFKGRHTSSCVVYLSLAFLMAVRRTFLVETRTSLAMNLL
jgi:hypothetical protein